MTIAELIPALNSNKIDIIVANVLATPVRKALIDLSQLYHASGDGLIVRRLIPRSTDQSKT
jgi:ABC-type amino acid transport substrate-binding protein